MNPKGQIRIDDQGIDAAMARLDQLEAEEAGQNSPTAAEQSPESSVTDAPEQHAAQPGTSQEGSEQTNSEQQTDTRATADGEQPDPLKELIQQDTKTDSPEKKAETEAQKQEASRYEKARVRAAEEWKRINADKEALAKERQALQRERDQFERRRNPKPEELEARADQWERDLKLIEYDAIQAERKADQTGNEADEQAARQARQRFEEAKEERIGFIRASRKEAKRLRENPDPSAKDAEVRFKREQGEWWKKAATDYPEVAVKGSQLNQATAELMKSDSEFSEHPKGLYIATRIAAAEAAAARVPGLLKELESLKAKVAEWEQNASPGDAVIPVTNFGEREFSELSEAEQEAELRRLARSRT